MKQRIYLLTLFCTLFLLPTHAAKITGRIYDAKTRDFLVGVTIELLSPKDSSVIRRTISKDYRAFGSMGHYEMRHYEIEVERDSSYILCFSMLGYKTVYKNITVNLPKSMERWFFEDILMQEDAKALQEVVVKATRVKMVMRGDTLVYNADAFNLSQGSMLDELIRQMPGARLKDGVITIQGKRVSSLLVDGRRFFNGDPKLALSHLPAYTVDKVKVYDHAGEASRLMGRDMGDKECVVDVNLKKRFKHGISGEAAMAGGTHERYYENVDILGFGKKNNIHLSGYFANVGPSPATIGNDMEQMRSGMGLPRNGEIEASYQRKGKTFDDESSVAFSITPSTIHHEQRTSRQTFLTGGDVYGGSNTYDREKTSKSVVTLSWGKRLKKQIMKALLKYSGSHGTSNNRSRSASFLASPDWADDLLDSLFQPRFSNRLRDITINRQGSEGRGRNYSDLLAFHLSDRIGIGKGTDNFANMLKLDLYGSHSKDNQLGYALNRYDYFGTNPRQDHRHEYTERPNENTNLEAGMSFGRLLTPKADKINTLFLNVDYKMMYNYRSANNSLFRLDRLAHYNADHYPLGVLPSSRDELKAVLDATNSDHSTNHEIRNMLTLRSTYTRTNAQGGPKISIKALLPLDFAYEKLRFFRQKQFEKSRNSLLMFPSVRSALEWNDSTGTRELSFEYTLRQNQRDLMSMLDVRSDANPLYVTLGNPDLKKAFSHDFSLRYAITSMRVYHPITSFNLNYGFVQNALATSVSYDKATGVTTSKPVNINGNWNCGLNVNHSRALDKNDKWNLTTMFSFSYNNSVDLMSVAGKGQERSRVRTFNNLGAIDVTWSPDRKFIISSNTMANNYIATGSRADFTKVNAWDISETLTSAAKLPWNLELKTMLTFNKRGGYNDTQMNTTNRLLNASLTKTLLQNKLSIALHAYDLLHDVKSVRFELNEQGRSETWTNSIPSFVMLRVGYKFTGGMKRRF